MDDRPKDVWSRSGSKYRVRAATLLAVNVLLFAGVGSFAYWLRSGERFAPAHEGYWDELRQTFVSVPFGDREEGRTSLGAMLMEPISVQEVPIQPWVVGLLMAALLATPILVAILYRFWACLPFLAVVAFLAVMPWLAVTLLISCALASLPRFRTRFRFTSALLGLMPAVIYLVLAWRGTTELVAGEIDPVDRIKFIAPWVLAIVSAAVVFALVLSIAKLVDYRPGAIAPLLGVMLILPVWLFEVYVGRDELYYRLLVTLDRGHFLDIHPVEDLERAVREAWLRHPPPRPSLDAVRELEEMRWMFQLSADIGPTRSALTRHQQEIVVRCDDFLKYFPRSRYAYHVLFLRARALDMRVDAEAFRRTQWIRFYDDFPGPASWSTWRKLEANHPGGALEGIALLRLAQLEAREGDVERAIDKAKRAVTFLEQALRQTGEESPGASAGLAFLGAHREDGGLNLQPERARLEAYRLHDLLVANRDPIYGYEPISGPRRPAETFRFGLLDLDPRSESYRENLALLLRWYPDAQIEDNVLLEQAKAADTLDERRAFLERCVRRFEGRDAVPEALYRLGLVYLERGRSADAESTLGRLMREFPDSIWAEEAAGLEAPRTAGANDVAAAGRAALHREGGR